MVTHEFVKNEKSSSHAIKLDNGSRIAVIGGGPAGSLFSYFLLDMAMRVDMDVHVDIYEPRDFSVPGPAGCNMCGGIVSESLVQTLATEGINLPDTVIQRGLDSYVLHTDEGKVRIDTPLQEKRIAAMHRGAGPRGIKTTKWGSFDSYLIKLTENKGARLVRKRVSDVEWKDDKLQIDTKDGECQTYDLVAVAVGVNTPTLKIFEGLKVGYRPPRTTKTYICELFLGQEIIEDYFGSSMHVFLLNIPRLEFAAIIPKGDYVTICLLGKDIDRSLTQSFLNTPEVKECFPSDWLAPDKFCNCFPKINVHGAHLPFADRIVFVGDCGITRLYKDGIGAAYRTAKAAATTVIFEGISAEDFRRYYWPACMAISKDNKLGELIFSVTRLIQKIRYAHRGVLRMVSAEQQKKSSSRRMCMVLWDTFTGSAPYSEIFLRTLSPLFLVHFLQNIVAGILLGNAEKR